MANVIAGAGLGLFNSFSANSIALGQGKSQVFVNAATGNLVVQNNDETINGKGMAFGLVRTYNSSAGNDGDNNDQWRMGHLSSVALEGTANAAGSRIRRIHGDGFEQVFEWNGSQYLSKTGSGAFDSLVWSAGGVVVSFENGVTETYNTAGNLSKRTDADGELRIDYNAQNKASFVALKKTDGTEELSTLLYNTDGLLTGLRTSSANGAQQLVTYEYDGSKRLAKVRIDLTPDNTSDAIFYETNFTYSGTTTRLETISQSDGSKMTMAYYADGRLKSITDALNRITLLEYISTDQTRMTVAGEVTNYYFDSQERLLRTERIVGFEQLNTNYTYTANGQLESILDAEGGKVVFGYDAKGNLTSQTDALNNTRARTYNAQNQLLTDTFDGVTERYVYDTNGLTLRFKIAADGAVTELRYTANGLLSQSRLYSKNAYNVTALAANAAPSLSAMQTWLAGITDKSAQQLTTYDYDFRGQLSKTSQFSNVDAAGAGTGTASTTAYLYDFRGRLLAETTARGVETTAVANDFTKIYSYDGLGRILSIKDATNATTSYVYSDSLQKQVVTYANGLIETTTFDKAGMATSVIRSNNGGTALAVESYQYDAQGRLALSKDAFDNIESTIYDAAGRIGATVNASGFITRFHYDRAGRVIAKTEYNGAVLRSGWYTATNVLITLDKLDQQLIKAQSVDALRRTTQYVYDAAGNKRYEIDAEGWVTQFSYDKSGRLLSSKRRTEKLEEKYLTQPYYFNAATNINNWWMYDVRAPGSIELVDDATLGTKVAQLTGTGTTTGFELAADSSKTYFADSLHSMLQIQMDYPASGWTMYINVETTLGQRYVQYTPGTAAAKITNTSYLQYSLDPALFGKGWTTVSRDLAADIQGLEPNNALLKISSVLIRGSGKIATVQAQGVNLAGIDALAGTYQTLASQTYTKNGQLESQIDGEGFKTLFTYNNAGQKIAERRFATANTDTVSPNDRVAFWFYDNAGRLTAQIDGDGVVTSFAYNTENQLVSSSQYEKTIRNYSLGTVLALPSGNKRTTSYSYDANGRLLTETNAEALTTVLKYDAMGNVIERWRGTLSNQTTPVITTGTAWSLERNQYDLLNRTTATLDANANALLGASATATVVNTAFANSATSKMVYDQKGQVTDIFDAEGNRTMFYYDVSGNLRVKVDAAGQVTEYEQNAFGETVYEYSFNKPLTAANLAELVAEKNASAKAHLWLSSNKIFTFIRAGSFRTASKVSALGLNRLGQTTYSVVSTKLGTTTDGVLNISNSSKGGTYFSYNAIAALVKTTVASETSWNSTAQTYNTANFISEVTVDNRGVATSTKNTANIVTTTSQTTDAFGRMVSSTDVFGKTTTYDYKLPNNTADTAGRVVQTTLNVTAQAGDTSTARAVRVDYDAFGRQLATTDALGNVTTYTYDDSARTITVLTADGISTITTRDVLGRVILSEVKNGSVSLKKQGFEYDNNGNLLKSYQLDGASKFGETSATFDKNNRTITQTNALGLVVTLKYDAVGRQIFSEYQLDKNDTADLTSLKTLVTSTVYRERLSAREGNSIKTDFGYEIVQTSAAGTTVSIYDAEGQLLSVRQQETLADGQVRYIATDYSYSLNGQVLTTVSGVVYTLDTNQIWSNGNYTNAIATRNEYDAAQRLVKQTQLDMSAGSLQTAQVLQTTSFAYDNANRLIETIKNPGNSVFQRELTSYNEAGEVLLRIQVADNLGAAGKGRVTVTSYQYDKNGRVLAAHALKEYVVLSAAVTSTSPAYQTIINEVNAVIKTAAKASTYSAYDKLGRQIATINAEAGITFNRLDNLGRVVEQFTSAVKATTAQIDAAKAGTLTVGASTSADRRSINIFNSKGEKAFTLNSSGTSTQVVGYSYDANGNLVSSKVYAVEVAYNANYTTATLTTALNAALSAKSLTDSANATSQYVYNKAGQLRFTVDALGAVTEQQYDDAGRVIASIRRAAVVSGVQTYATLKTKFAPNQLATGDLRTRNVYDSLGRVRFSIDAENYVTEQKYNANGQVVESVRYTDKLPNNTALTDLAIRKALYPAAVSQDFSAGQIGVQLNGSVGNSLRVEGGRLVSQNRSLKNVQTWPEIASTAVDYKAGALLTADVTTTELAGMSFTLGSSNGEPYASVGFRRHTFAFEDGNVTAQSIRGDDVKSVRVGSVKAHTTYVMEVEAGENETTLYLYEKGKTRAEGIIHTAAADNWNKFRLQGHSYCADGLIENTMYVDNVKLQSPQGSSTQYTYNTLGQLTDEYSPALTGESAVSSFANGKYELLTTSYGRKQYTYDAFGQMIALTEGVVQSIGGPFVGQTRTMKFEYDAVGRQTKVRQPTAKHAENTLTDITYDAFGNAVMNLVFDGSLRPIEAKFKVYNQQNQVLFDVEAELSAGYVTRGYVTEYQYDSFGNATKVTRYNQPIDLVASRGSNAYASALTESYVRSKLTPAYVNDIANRTIETSFDALGRKTKVLESARAFSYLDDSGVLQSASARPETRFEYNSLGQVYRQSVVTGKPGETLDTYFWYDALGRQVKTLDANNYLTTLEYTAFGELKQRTEHARAVTSSFSAAQAPTAPNAGDNSTGLDRVTVFSYDALGRQVQQEQKHVQLSDAAASVSIITSQQYDAFGKVSATTNADGTTRYDYDALGNLIKTTSAATALVQEVKSLSALTGVESQLQTQSRISKLKYDIFGNVIESRQLVGSSNDDTKDIVQLFEYNERGQQVKLTERFVADTSGNTQQKITETSYDAKGRTLSTTVRYHDLSPVRVVEVSGIWEINNPKNGEWMERTRTNLDWLSVNLETGVVSGRSPISGQLNSVIVKLLNAAGQIEQVSLSTMGLLAPGSLISEQTDKLKVPSNNGHEILFSTNYQYDSLGRQTATSVRKFNNSLNTLVDSFEEGARFNGFGEIEEKTVKGQDGVAIRQGIYAYNAAGLLTTSTEADGVQKTTYTDLAGRVVGVKDAQRGATRFVLDKAGRQTQVLQQGLTAGAAFTTLQSFDRWGNVVALTDATGALYQYQYNQFNQVVKETKPQVFVVLESGARSLQNPVTRYSYDQMGRKLSYTNANGATKFFAYNADGQLASETDAADSNAKTYYVYDSFGRKVATQDGEGRVEYSRYNELGLVVDSGRLLKKTNSSNVTESVFLSQQAYRYNAMGERMSSTNAVGASHFYRYDARGNVVNAVSPTNLMVDTRFDALNRKVFESTSAIIGGVRTAQSQSWAYLANGTQTHTDLGNNVTTSTFTAGGSGVTGGLMLSQTNTLGLNQSFSYYSNGWLKSVEASNGTSTYEYNAAGLRTAEVHKTITQKGEWVTMRIENRYDKLGRLVLTRSFDGEDAAVARILSQSAYQYDAEGNRRSIAVANGLEGVIAKDLALNPTGKASSYSEGQAVAISLNATGVSPTSTLYQLVGGSLPKGLTFDAVKGTISGTIAPDAVQGVGDHWNSQTFALDLLIKDEIANTQANARFELVVQNRPASWASQGLSAPALSGTAGQQFVISAGNFSKGPEGNPVGITVTSPAWLRYDAQSNSFMGTPPSAGAFSYVMRISDGGYGTIERAGTVSAASSNAGGANIPPRVVTALLPLVHERTASNQGDAYFYTPISNMFIDDNGDALSITASGLPTTLRLVVTNGGIEVVQANEGIYLNDFNTTVTLTAIDGRGGSAQATLGLRLVTRGSTRPTPNPKVKELSLEPELQSLGEVSLDNGVFEPAFAATTLSFSRMAVSAATPTAVMPSTDIVVGDVLMREYEPEPPERPAPAATLAGEVLSTASAKYQTEWFSYDGANRVLVNHGKLVGQAVSASEGGTVTLYNKAGQIAYEISGQAMATKYVYNDMLQLVAVQRLVNAPSENLLQNPAAVKAATADWRNISSFDYDAAGRVIAKYTHYQALTPVTIPRAIEVGDGQWVDMTAYVDLRGGYASVQRTTFDEDGRVLTTSELRAITSESALANSLIPVNYEPPLNRNAQPIVARGEHLAQKTNLTKNVSLTEYKDFNEGGQASAFSFTDYKADGSFNARRDFSKEYTLRESFLEKKVIGTGVASSGSISPGNTFIDYDLQGRKTLIQDQNNVNLSDISARRMLYAADGTLLRKEDGKMSTLNVPSSFTRDAYSLHITSNGNYLGEVARTKKVNDNTPVRFTDTLMAQHGAGMSQSEGSGVQSYQTQSGDTLASIALAFYGSSDYWYLIANRNGLSSTREAPIAAGQTLEVPSRATQVNSANSFKPMQLEQIIGDTTPGLPQLPPPPKCNAIAMIVMIAITVVATIATAGAAAAAMGGGMSTFSMSLGASAMMGGAAVGTVAAGTIAGTAAMAAAAAGGFVGSVAGQLAGKAMGVVESFSLRNAFASGLTAGATAGMGGYLQGVEWAQAAGNADKLGTVGKMALAASSAGINVGANKLAGNNQASFKWRNVVTAAATAGVMDKLNLDDIDSPWGRATSNLDFGSGIINGFAGAAVGYGVGKALYNKGGWSFRDVATDVFGNALGNSIVSGLSTKQTEQQAERKGNEAFEKAKAAGMTDTQASKVATDEMLSMLPPDKRRQLLVDNDGERLSINFAGKNGKVDRNQGGLSMSLAGDDFRSRHSSLVDFISDEGLWGNNQMLGLATGLLDKRAAYYSYDSIAKRGQQVFESAAASSQARYNHINRDRIAQQQGQRETSRILDSQNKELTSQRQAYAAKKAAVAETLDFVGDTLGYLAVAALAIPVVGQGAAPILGAASFAVGAGAALLKDDPLKALGIHVVSDTINRFGFYRAQQLSGAVFDTFGQLNKQYDFDLISKTSKFILELGQTLSTNKTKEVINKQHGVK